MSQDAQPTFLFLRQVGPGSQGRYKLQGNRFKARRR